MRPGLDAILPELLVGEYPRVEDLAWLRDEHGVTAVVNLQDDADLASKRLDVADLERACAELGLAFERLPVADGDPDGARRPLPGVVERLHALIGAGARVYLHCNAGYNRAPTVGHRLRARASRTVARRRLRAGEAARSCVPYMSALRARYGEPD